MIQPAAIGEERLRLRTWSAGLYGLAFTCGGLFLLWLLYSGEVGQSLMMVVATGGGLFAVALVWRHPQVTVYALFGAAVVIESRPLGSGLSITDRIPAFHNLQTFLPLPGVILNPVEALALLCLGVLLAKSLAGRAPSMTMGPLRMPFLLLLAVIVLGILRGYEAGGDVRIALWGVRGLLLLFIAYLLTVNLVRDRSQARVLIAILVTGAMLKGLIGLWRYAIDFRGQIGPEVETGLPGNSLMSHSESFFFLMVALLLPIALAFRLPKRERQWALIGFVIVLIPLLANQRRVAIAVLILSIVVLLIVLFAFEPRLRRSIVRGLVLALVILPVYAAVTWNSSSLVAMPVQAVKSSFAPQARDASSNDYRDIENHNMRLMARGSPLLGAGFGVPMVQDQVLPDLSASYEWYLYLPHNGLLWMGMAVGLPGLAVFSYLIACMVLRTVAAIRCSAADPHARALFLIALLAISGYLTYVLFDQGILDQRQSIFLGVMMGLLALAPRPASEPETAPTGAGASQ